MLGAPICTCLDSWVKAVQEFRLLLLLPQLFLGLSVPPPLRPRLLGRRLSIHLLLRTAAIIALRLNIMSISASIALRTRALQPELTHLRLVIERQPIWTKRRTTLSTTLLVLFYIFVLLASGGGDLC